MYKLYKYIKYLYMYKIEIYILINRNRRLITFSS